MPAISVIVPIYNVYNQLVDCLDSIRGQSLENFECILIDDGSTDGSSELLDEYVKIDHRFQIIHQENSGVGAARNKGLLNAQGTFITFIDSDDQVMPKYLENMLHAIDQKDILITGFTMCRLENREKIGSIAGDPSTENMARAMKEGLLNSCWGKLYRREVIWGLRFSEEIFWGEDTAYLMSCLCRTDKVIFCPFHDYLYTFSTSGLVNRFDKQKPYYLGAYYKQLILFLEQWAENADSLYNEVAIKISQEILRTIDTLVDKKLSQAEEKEYLRILFADSKVNRLFSYGTGLDNNPAILKALSKFPDGTVWKGYIGFRRCVLKGRK